MSKNRVSRERILLLTLVDLLMQLSFVFYAGYADANSKLEVSEQVSSKAATTEKELYEITGKMSRLRSENEQLKTRNQELDAKLMGNAKPPCHCTGQPCKTRKDALYVAVLEVYDDGVGLNSSQPESPEKQMLTKLAGKKYDTGSFNKVFDQFRRAECVNYVRWHDRTSATNKDGYKAAVDSIRAVFAGNEIKMRLEE